MEDYHKSINLNFDGLLASHYRCFHTTNYTSCPSNRFKSSRDNPFSFFTANDSDESSSNEDVDKEGGNYNDVINDDNKDKDISVSDDDKILHENVEMIPTEKNGPVTPEQDDNDNDAEDDAEEESKYYRQPEETIIINEEKSEHE